MPKFCYECGAPLPEGVKFCPECGMKVVATADHSIMPTSQALRSPGKNLLTLPLLGSSVRFDQSIGPYRKLRWAFERLAEQESTDFYKSFYKNYTSMDAFMNKFPGDFPPIFQRAVDCMNAWLSSIEVFGVTRDEMAPYVHQHCVHTFSILQNIEEQYVQIVGRQEEMEQYRKERKDSRGRVGGFGFGLGGYMKAAATAGAINLTTGILHSAVNAVGNLGTAISTSNAKERLLKSGINNELSDAIYEDIMSVHLVAVELAANRRQTPMVSFTSENTRQAEQIQRELEEGRMPPAKWASAVTSLLTADPFYTPGYHTAVKFLPGRLEELREFADYFSEDIDDIYGELRENGDVGIRVLLEYKKEFTPLLLGDLGYAEELQPLTSDLEDLLDYLSNIFSWAEEKGFYFLPETTEDGSSVLRNASYADYGDETPLILYDAVPGKRGAEGFLITEKTVYLNCSGQGAASLSLREVLQDDLEEGRDGDRTPYLRFGDYNVTTLNSGVMVHERVLSEFLRFGMAAILFLTSYRPLEQDLWQAVAGYQRLPQPKNVAVHPSTMLPENKPAACYCFECGAENSPTDRFCFECGAELI